MQNDKRGNPLMLTEAHGTQSQSEYRFLPCVPTVLYCICLPFNLFHCILSSLRAVDLHICSCNLCNQTW